MVSKELYGRQYLFFATYMFLTSFNAGAADSQNIETLIILRFLAVGGFVGQTIGWRWIEGVMAIFSGVLWLIYTLLIPETYALVLLRKRAAALLKRTGQVYKSKSDVEQGTKSIGTAFKTALIRPWLLLFREPIVLLLSLYMTVVYGTLYMLFGAFPIVYQQGRG
ncbi:hypothetical protein J4E82_011378 [Alternaria postmessia]|uniref:uncharacterized protein n=1 Tax=Alternaria postmessia TaxID=1187938 RepID=UPI002223EF92|nr:uncharacterized protein J4E82_011378 [Alternaria postmessia]KAI5365584.1 hypothetical protein J4E82_011378 [Alternaria postmessia]